MKRSNQKAKSAPLLLSIVMKEGWNGLDLGKALAAEQKKISAGRPACRHRLQQSDRSGSQHPRSSG